MVNPVKRAELQTAFSKVYRLFSYHSHLIMFFCEVIWWSRKKEKD